MNPNIPEQPDEIAQAALECYNAGAAIVHIHARDEKGKPTGTKEKFDEIQQAVRGKCKEVIIQFSTGGGAELSLEERMACLEMKPEMASLNMGTLMRQTGPNAGQPFSNMTKDIEAWAAKMLENGTKPEMECYSQSMFRDVENLIKKNLLEAAVLLQLRARHDSSGRHRGQPRYAHTRCATSCPRALTSTPSRPRPPSFRSPR